MTELEKEIFWYHGSELDTLTDEEAAEITAACEAKFLRIAKKVGCWKPLRQFTWDSIRDVHEVIRTQTRKIRVLSWMSSVALLMAAASIIQLLLLR